MTNCTSRDTDKDDTSDIDSSEKLDSTKIADEGKEANSNGCSEYKTDFWHSLVQHNKFSN